MKDILTQQFGVLFLFTGDFDEFPIRILKELHAENYLKYRNNTVQAPKYGSNLNKYSYTH